MVICKCEAWMGYEVRMDACGCFGGVVGGEAWKVEVMVLCCCSHIPHMGKICSLAFLSLEVLGMGSQMSEVEVMFSCFMLCGIVTRNII